MTLVRRNDTKRAVHPAVADGCTMHFAPGRFALVAPESMEDGP